MSKDSMSDDSNVPWGIREILACFKPASANVTTSQPRLKDLKATVLRVAGKVSMSSSRLMAPSLMLSFISRSFLRRMPISFVNIASLLTRQSECRWSGMATTLRIPATSRSTLCHTMSLRTQRMKKNLTVWDWCRIFMGTYPGLPEQHRNKSGLVFNLYAYAS